MEYLTQASYTPHVVPDYGRLWWILARANYLGKGDLSIPIGKQLRIPEDYLGILDEYKKLNN